jgi:predicted dehydrogenase
MSLGNPVRVGLVGCGYWGPNLARNLHQIPQTQLAVCCDQDPQALSRLRMIYPQADTTTQYREVLADRSIDAVVVATPARSHYALARDALLADKHVLVEKPLAMSSEEAREMISLAEQRRRVLMVGHIFEYHPAVREIKSLIDAGDLGQVYYIYSTRVNLGRVQSDINALWSIAPHDISILNYLLGAMPESVSAHGGTFLNGTVEDVVFLVLGFPGGVLGHVHASWLDPSKVRRMTIVGSRRMVVYDDVAGEGKIKIYDKGVYRKGDDIFGEFQYRVHSGDISIPKIDMTEPLRIECTHFAECILQGRQPLTDGLNGLRVVQVLEAAQASLGQGGSSVSLLEKQNGK